MKTKYALLGETYGSEGIWLEDVIQTGSRKEIKELYEEMCWDNSPEFRSLWVEKYDAHKPEDLALYEGIFPDDEEEAEALYEKINS